jgi:hypothetical protein
MSEPKHRICLFGDPRYVWKHPCRPVSGCDCWDESDLEVPCSTRGCQNHVSVEYATYSQDSKPDLKFIGDCFYNSGRNDAVYYCNCKSPVCEDCSSKCGHGPCRICGEQADIEVLFKRRKRLEDNCGHPERDWWMMKHEDARRFIDRNIGELVSSAWRSD